jgi:hypothetical protein
LEISFLYFFRGGKGKSTPDRRAAKAVPQSAIERLFAYEKMIPYPRCLGKEQYMEEKEENGKQKRG